MKVDVKKGLLLLWSFLFCLHVNAQNVAYDLAKNIATNFLAVKKESNHTNFSVSNEHTMYNSSGEALVYIFNFEGGGFVIVSADKNAEPVLAYSTTNSFSMEGENEAAKDFVRSYAHGISYAKEVKMEVSPTLQSKWEKAEMGDFTVKGQKATIVGPLLTSNWNQNKYYNALCPDDAGAPIGYDDRVPNGCVALAMAQIMYYHRYPKNGYGASSYTAPGYGVQTANYGTANYDYDAMSDKATGFSNDIAKLCYHAGVSVKMGYGKDASGAYSTDVPAALNSRFLYKYVTHTPKGNTSDAVWGGYLKVDLNKGLPVYYSACRQNSTGGIHGCHAFVCDGYDDRSGVDYFHFNFGWGGSSNGFYTLGTIYDASNPANAYVYQNAIITGIEPQTEATKSTGKDTLVATYGSFSDGSSPRKDYENNSNRSWLISPQKGKNITKIVLTTAYFSTEDNNDIVTIYSGNAANPSEIVAVLSGNVDTTIGIFASEVFVTFTSNGSITAQGFKFTYTSTMTSTTSCPKTVPHFTAAITDPTGNIAVDGYDAETECFWALKPAGAKHVGITFTKFNIEEGDFVELNQWNGSIGLTYVKYPTHKVGNNSRFTKANPPILGREYQVPDVGAFIYFRTDNKLNGTGFSFNWRCYDVSVNEAQAGIETLSVYPNPASDRIKVQIETLQPEAVQIAIYDMVGRVVSNISASEATQQFIHNMDVSHLAKGLYMMQITTSRGQVMRKIAIQ